VNLRHLGFVRDKVTHPLMRSALLHQMISRVLKNLIRDHMRQNASLPREAASTPLVQFMQSVLLHADPIAWSTWIKQHMQHKYECGLSPEEQDSNYNLQKDLDFGYAFKNILEEIGVELTQEAMDRINQIRDWPQSLPITAADIVGYKTVTDYPAFVWSSQAVALMDKASKSKDDKVFESLRNATSVHIMTQCSLLLGSGRAVR